MNNPNNCAACDHKQQPQGGWCYMFRDEPTKVCLCHTALRGMTAMEAVDMIYSARSRGEVWQHTTMPHSKTPNVLVEPVTPATEDR